MHSHHTETMLGGIGGFYLRPYTAHAVVVALKPLVTPCEHAPSKFAQHGAQHGSLAASHIAPWHPCGAG